MGIKKKAKKKAVKRRATNWTVPEDLAEKEALQRITIYLSRRSVTGFKKLAKKHQVPYQKLIRRLLDDYVKESL